MLSNLEKILLFHVKSYNLHTGDYADLAIELMFCKERRWRFDIAWTNHKVAVEAEGGTWIHGGHVRGKLYEDNCSKYNCAALLGWRVFRFTTDQIKSGSAIQTILQALNHHEAKPLPQPLDSCPSKRNNRSKQRL